MKILLIGAGGTIGSAVDKELSQRHEVIRIGRSSGDFQVDISDSASIRKLFEQTGKFDALVCAAGNVTFAPLGGNDGRQLRSRPQRQTHGPGQSAADRPWHGDRRERGQGVRAALRGDGPARAAARPRRRGARSSGPRSAP